jgi:hypothetical protein
VWALILATPEILATMTKPVKSFAPVEASALGSVKELGYYPSLSVPV